MEDVLEVSTRPDDPRRPQVWLDETSRQLLGEVTRPAQWPRAGRPDTIRSTSAVGVPLAGWRQVMVSDRRTRIDWAHSQQGAVDVHYPTPNRSCWSKTTSTPT